MSDLARDLRNQAPLLQRFRPAGVIPLELWDLCVGERILWDFMRDPGFAAILIESLHRVHSGEAATRSDGPVPRAAHGFEAVFIGGGHGATEALRDHSSHCPWPIAFSEEGAFVGERGGLELLASNHRAGVVIDLGQTNLKISDSTRRWTFPRDFKKLPMRDESPDVDRSSQRGELRRFLGDSIRQCAAQSTPPVEAVVFALPARLDNDGVPEGSSYAGMEGDSDLIPDALALAGLGRLPAWALNDAELAALSARLHPAVTPSQRTLVLTLGFGLGAALLTPCP